MGAYRIIRRLGGGGMGDVYLAVKSGTGGFEREVALKVILSERADDPRLQGLFEREGRLAGLLNHRAVVQVFDVGVSHGRMFMAMEYLQGIDLRRLVRAQGGKLDWPAAVHIASEVARGLAAAHELRRPGAKNGLVHGDISPSNVMACADGAVKVLDFGLSRPVGVERSVSGLEGKLAYLPPEAANGGVLDHRLDLYALGVVLYWMVTGVQPFQGRTELETLQRIVQQTVEPPSALTGGLPDRFDEIVMKAIARDAARRYSSAGKMADAIDSLGAAFGARDLARLVADSEQRLAGDEARGPEEGRFSSDWIKLSNVDVVTRHSETGLTVPDSRSEDVRGVAANAAARSRSGAPTRRRGGRLAGLVLLLALVAGGAAVAAVKLTASRVDQAPSRPAPAEVPAPRAAATVPTPSPAADPPAPPSAAPSAAPATPASGRPRSRSARTTARRAGAAAADAGPGVTPAKSVDVQPDMPIRY
jgi:serine/threonine protein kinase